MPGSARQIRSVIDLRVAIAGDFALDDDVCLVRRCDLGILSEKLFAEKVGENRVRVVLSDSDRNAKTLQRTRLRQLRATFCVDLPERR